MIHGAQVNRLNVNEKDAAPCHEHSFAEADATAPPSAQKSELPISTTALRIGDHGQGEIVTEGGVQVRGRFEGVIRSQQGVMIMEGGVVDALIVAEHVLVAGEAKGTVLCRGRFEALATSSVSGEVRTRSAVIHDGATLNARIRMAGQDGLEELAHYPAVAKLGRAVYTPDGLHMFLTTPSPRFDDRTALELMRGGEAERVISALASDYEAIS